jgi:hypothetical protein
VTENNEGRKGRNGKECSKEGRQEVKGRKEMTENSEGRKGRNGKEGRKKMK